MVALRPRPRGRQLHVHRRHTDLFYVLDGELEVRLGVGDEPVAVPAGMLARVPPLVVHGFRNGSDADVRYLNFHAPGCDFADFLRALRDDRSFSYDQHPPPADGGRPTTDAVVGSDGFVHQRPGLRMALLADVDEIAIAETSAEGDEQPPPHMHRAHVESFYVLEGAVTLTAAGRELRAEAGTWLQVPPGVPHALAFPGERPARFLDIHTPNYGFGAFLRDLDGAQSDAAPAGFDQVPA